MSLNINPFSIFPAFAPYSGGSETEKSFLTIQSVNQVFPALVALANEHQLLSSAIIKTTEEFIDSSLQLTKSLELKNLFDSYSSDKANVHNYHYVYGKILADNNKIEKVFEIGLGTNNVDVVSNMGSHGKPGASLRAFRDFLPHAKIYGADVDSRILFSEDRIETFYVDQVNLKTFETLSGVLPSDFDLIIDDGLHSPNANLHSLSFALKHVKQNGYVVIEDIHKNSLDIWKIVVGILSTKYKVDLLHSDQDVYILVLQNTI